MVQKFGLCWLGCVAAFLTCGGWAQAASIVEPGVNPHASVPPGIHATTDHGHGPGCISCSLASAGAAGDEAGVDAFRISGRWSQTAQQPGSSNLQGTPMQLTWGFVGDGTAINPAISGESTDPSDLVAFFDGLYDPSSTGGSDLTQRAWFRFFDESFGRLDELSGLSYTYEPNDDGVTVSGSTSSAFRGSVGVRPDIRIAGHSIDGQSGSNVLAYNYFPIVGDMVIDTDNRNTFGSTAFDSRLLRNTIMHEAGHGVGLSHLESNNSDQLMEPFISFAFEGPQFDDILALHRNYGDAREEDGGNDTPATADFLGSLGLGDSVSLGTDAGNSSLVSPAMTDFLSIDDRSDADVFRFTVTEPAAEVTATVTPVGPTYNEGPQNGAQSPLVTSALSDLVLQLMDANGSVIVTVDNTLAGAAETLSPTAIGPGDWFVRVLGRDFNVQMYRLDLAIIPEPAAVLLGLGTVLFVTRRKRPA